MSLWTRRPTVIGGTTEPNDWTVIYAQTWMVGRVYAEWTSWLGHHWRWFNWTDGGAPKGMAPTLEEAQQAVRAAVVIRGGVPVVSGDLELYRVR